MKRIYNGHPQKEGSFVLCNVAGLEWEMLKDGEVLSAFPDHISESNSMIATSNKACRDKPEIIKKMTVAIIKQNIYDSIDTMNKLVGKAGYEDFEIDIDYVIEQLKAPPDIKIH